MEFPTIAVRHFLMREVNMADSGLDYSCIGEGTSTEETVEDFKRSYEGMKDYFKETGRPFEEVEFDFRFPSLQIPFRQI